jgi:hypothetical protein
MNGFLSWVLTALLALFCGAIVAPFFAANFRKLLEVKGWDTIAVKLWDPMIAWVKSIRKKRGFWFIFGLIIGILATSLYPAHEKQTSVTANQPSATAENPPPPYIPPADRVFTGKTPTQLYDFFVATTDVQARAQIQFYVNTWVEVSGSLKDVAGDTLIFSEFGYPATMYGLTMQFRAEKWLQRLRVMKIGTKLKVIGEFTAADKLGIYLDNCEIVEEGATQKAPTAEKPTP